MHKNNRSMAACAALFLLTGCQNQEPEQLLDAEDIDQLTLHAPFIFEGTINKTDDSTIPNLRVDGPTAIVTVDKVLKAPKTFGDYTNRKVTLLIKDAVTRGEQAVFFTEGFAYGRSLAVRELRRLSPDNNALRELTVQKITDIPARLFRAHVNASELVVVGRVDAILSPPEEDEVFISEHYPYWRGARIHIVSVEYGRFDKQTLLVPFPLSQDVMWWGRPQFKTGTEGIWILHPHSADPAGDSLFDVMHQSDFLPMQSLNFVREQIALRTDDDVVEEYMQ